MKNLKSICFFLLLLILLSVSPQYAHAGNLIKNPSQEQYVSLSSGNRIESIVLLSSVKANPESSKPALIKSDLAKEIDIFAVSAIAIISIYSLGSFLYRKHMKNGKK